MERFHFILNFILYPLSSRSINLFDLRAAALAGMEDLPARVLNASEEALREISLIENVQRRDLSPIEIASALQALIRKNGLTQENYSLNRKSVV